MATLSRRFQILLEERQADILQTESRTTGRSVASLIREAIDQRYHTDSSTRRSAMEAFLSAPPVDVQDWAIEKRLIRDELAGVDDD